MVNFYHFTKLFLRYYNTLKYLKISQIFFRILFILEIRSIPKRVDFKLKEFSNNWVKKKYLRDSIIKCNYFNFLNKEQFIDLNTWNNPDLDKLWIYNLHYFNYLNTKKYKEIYTGTFLIEKWISANPPCEGVGWERYPTSIRIVNWVKWFLSGNTINNDIFESLFVQSRWIFKNPERHLLGNHFFSNLKALIFSSCIFNTKESDNWFVWSIKKINIEINEQVLNDGGHFERSTMYHALFLEDMLDLINLSYSFDKIEKSTVSFWKATSIKMLFWLKKMIHPDKEISYFNDASIGVSSTYKQLYDYSSKLNIDLSCLYNDLNKNSCINCTVFNDSGYIILSNSTAALFIDVAPLGPDYLPAHGHADTLSFEMSFFGERVIVNRGTSCYGNNPIRLEERKTCSHNTVEINNKDSSEVWNDFRVADRAYPKNLSVKKNKSEININCSHTGYSREKNGIWPIRNWKMKNNEIEILDTIKGDYVTAYSRVIFHPKVSILRINKSVFEITLKSQKVIKLILMKGQGELIKTKYALEFGKLLDTSCLLIKINNNISQYKLIWQ